MASVTGTPEALPAPDSRRTAWIRLVVTGLLLGAVWRPALPGAEDGFPFSTYPMFGYAQSGETVVETVVGVEADGRRRPLTPWHVAATTRTKQALATARAAVRRGQTLPLCREVAARLVQRPLPTTFVAVEVVSDTWRTLDVIEPGAGPLDRQVHARCEVP